LKKHNNSSKKSEQRSKQTKSRVSLQKKRDTKEVMAELLEKLTEKLGPKAISASAGKEQGGGLHPNLDRLTVGVDLGDQWSAYCILGVDRETLIEGQLQTTQPSVAEFFQGLTAARVVLEVGTHSAWGRDVISGYGHEVLVANPRLMEGSKRRKRKSDRIDANKLARLGRMDPQSLYAMQHRSSEVRQDLVLLRARDALVTVRTELINTTRGLVKSMGARLPKCSSPSFSPKVEEVLPAEIRDGLLPLVQLVAALSDFIKGYDKKTEKLGSEKYGHTALVRQLTGVGPAFIFFNYVVQATFFRVRAARANVRGMSSTRITRRVNAPRANVYRALLDTRAVATWMVPTGMTSHVRAFDAREGGWFRISLTYDTPTGTGKTTAHTDMFHGRFVKLVTNEQVVEVVEFETTAPALRGEMTITIALTDADGGTDVLAVHDGLPRGLSTADNEEGWRSSLAKLAALVEAGSYTQNR